MAARAAVRRQPPKAARFASGPWRGARITNDPFDGGADLLTDATNVYAPDVQGKSGMYAIPGFSLDNNGQPVTTSTSRFQGQGAFSHTDLAGTTTNFVVFNGELWRRSVTGTGYENVTPVGITIDPTISSRVYGTTFADQFIITDGVNPPWLATDLASSPITGTAIDYDGNGTAWSAFGPFEVYGGSVFCILNEVGGTARRSDISWSIAGDAATGWQQTNYDFNWTLLQSIGQTAPPPLYRLVGTNTALYYFRELSIGALAGPVGPTLRNDATHDQISENIGTLTPQSVVQYGTTIYFIDQVGRPYHLVPGADPDAIWLQLRAVVDAATIGFPAVTSRVATAAYEPTLNLWIGASWSLIPSAAMPCQEGYIFDARTSQFFSRFVLAQGAQIEAMGNFLDADGRSTLVILGSLVPPSGSTPAASGYVWTLNALASSGDLMTTEATPALDITTEATPALMLATEGNDAANWDDGPYTKTRSITSPRFGYDASTVLSVDRAAALVAPGMDVAVSVATAAVAQTVEGSPTPSTVQDGIAKITAGFAGIQGRGVRVTIAPTSTDGQWSAQQITCDATVNVAAPDEP